MPSLETPRPARVRARAGLASARAAAAAALLLALMGSTPASAQDRPLQLFFRQNAQDSTIRPLPAGTRLRVFGERLSGREGRNASPDSIPPRGSATLITDSVGKVQDDHGITARPYADSMRYLVIAKTQEGIFWSVQGTNTTLPPRYHSLDQVPRIRMAVVPQAKRAALDSLFAAAATPPRIDEPRPPAARKKRMVELRGVELAGLLLLAAIFGLAGGWFARDHVSRMRRIADSKARAAQSREFRSQSTALAEFGDDRVGGGLGNEGWVALPAKVEKREHEALDQVLELRLTELESRICGHVTDQIKYARGDILGHLESSGIQPAGATRPGLTRQAGRAALLAPGEEHDFASQAAAAFVWWCQNAGGNVSKVKDFTDAIRGTVAGSEVHVLARDRDSNAVTFVSGGAGDPIEYWMVSAKGQSLLFPRPLKLDRFRELHPVYEGHAAPQSIRSIKPASVRQDGARWVLDSPGQVS